MGRSPCCAKEGLNRGAWTAMEDKLLIDFIKLHGEGKWRNLPKRAGLKRCGKSCRLRWLNYLRPDIKRGNISADEEDLIIRLHNLLGNRWSLIAGRLPGRTDNEIKNYWNTNIGKRIQASHKNANDVTNVKTTCRLPPSPKPATPQPTTTTAPVEPHQSTVFRTKATRCTKVVLFPPEKPILEPPTVTAEPKPLVHGDMVDSAVLDHDQRSSMIPTLPGDDDDHENFLSELLSMEGECFQQFSDCFHVEENGQSSIINGGDNILFNDEDIGHVIEPAPFKQSPATDIDRSDDYHHHHHRDQANNFLFSENMASLMEPDLDWLFQD